MMAIMIVVLVYLFAFTSIFNDTNPLVPVGGIIFLVFGLVGSLSKSSTRREMENKLAVNNLMDRPFNHRWRG